MDNIRNTIIVEVYIFKLNTKTAKSMDITKHGISMDNCKMNVYIWMEFKMDLVEVGEKMENCG
jgi:hypothetical protein